MNRTDIDIMNDIVQTRKELGKMIDQGDRFSYMLKNLHRELTEYEAKDFQEKATEE